jgi:hypothetical protein
MTTGAVTGRVLISINKVQETRSGAEIANVTAESMRTLSTPSVTPSDHQVARAVARVESDRSIGVAEASTLLCARDEHLDRMTAEARRVRDAGLVAAGRPVWSLTRAEYLLAKSVHRVDESCHPIRRAVDERPAA